MLAAAAGLSAVLWLAACGGSSTPSKQAASARTTASTSAQTQSHTTGQSSTAAKPPSAPAFRVREIKADAARATILEMSDCLAGHGIKVPPQDPSSENPVFNGKGLDTTSLTYKHCVAKAIAAYKTTLKQYETSKG